MAAKKGHSATQPKSGWYKGGTATMTKMGKTVKPKATTAHHPSGRGK